MKNWTATFALGLSAFAANAQTFDFTVPAFRAAYDRQAATDAADPKALPTIKAVVKTGTNTYSLPLSDAAFRRMVAQWKAMNLANGKFELKDKMNVRTAAQQKIDLVVVSSSREDMNAFHFLDTFANVLRTFNPGYKDEEFASLVTELELMQGDKGAHLGEVRTSFTKGAAISCLQFPVKLNADITCRFTPRF